jgi:SAM-dependent methyltransferase
MNFQNFNGNLRAVSRTETVCRACKSKRIVSFLDLGVTPLADRLLTSASENEPVFPLNVVFCEECALVQITETVAPEILFADAYPYYSSFSPALLAHARENVLEILASRILNNKSLIIELASNDGYLLKNYKESGIPVLGIDPAEGPAAAAECIGVPTLQDFFTLELAEKLCAEGKYADVVHANNVLAHVADTNGFVRGLRAILKPNGIAVIEVPYVMSLIDHVEFDTIYHEHLCYFSVTAIDNLFRRHGLFLNRVKLLKIHGGSLRLFAEPKENVTESVTEQLRLERELGLNRFEFFRDFSNRVATQKAELVSLVHELKTQGKRIAAYGAAAKGATLLNYCGLSSKEIDFVVDRNSYKQGKFMPGAHVPVCDPSALLEEKPDYVLLLTWNFADEIFEQQAAYRATGGKFIVPVPSPRII